jgi:hypothetical protein
MKAAFDMRWLWPLLRQTRKEHVEQKPHNVCEFRWSRATSEEYPVSLGFD